MERIFFKGLRENSCRDDLEIYFQRYFLEPIKLGLSRYQICGRELQSIIELAITPQVAYFLNNINISFKTTISVLKIIPVKGLNTIILSGVPQSISLARLFSFSAPITPGLINLTEIDIPGDEEKKEILAEYENYESAYAAYEFFQSHGSFQKFCKVYLKDPELDLHAELSKFSNVISVEDIPAGYSLEQIRRQFEMFGRVTRIKQINSRDLFVEYDALDPEAPRKAIEFFSKFNEISEYNDKFSSFSVQPAARDTAKKVFGKEEFTRSFNLLPEHERHMLHTLLASELSTSQDSFLDTFFNAKSIIGNLVYRLTNIKELKEKELEEFLRDTLIEEGLNPREMNHYVSKILNENALTKPSLSDLAQSTQFENDPPKRPHNSEQFEYSRKFELEDEFGERDGFRFRDRNSRSPRRRKHRQRRRHRRSRSRNRMEQPAVIGPEPPSGYIFKFLENMHASGSFTNLYQQYDSAYFNRK